MKTTREGSWKIFNLDPRHNRQKKLTGKPLWLGHRFRKTRGKHVLHCTKECLIEFPWDLKYNIKRLEPSYINKNTQVNANQSNRNISQVSNQPAFFPESWGSIDHTPSMGISFSNMEKHLKQIFIIKVIDFLSRF